MGEQILSLQSLIGSASIYCLQNHWPRCGTCENGHWSTHQCVRDNIKSIPEGRMWLDKTKCPPLCPLPFLPKATWMGYNSVAAAAVFVGFGYFPLTHAVGFSPLRWWPTPQAKESPSRAERPSTIGTGPTRSYSRRQSSPQSVSVFPFLFHTFKMQGQTRKMC